jgi:methyl coenzyme M reductase subunit C
LDSACIPDSSSVSYDIKLADLTSSIKRGTFIPKQSLVTSGSHFYVHSTNIRNVGLDTVTAPKFINVNDKIVKSGVQIECGDVLLVRVGKTPVKVNVVIKKERANGYISSCL